VNEAAENSKQKLHVTRQVAFVGAVVNLLLAVSKTIIGVLAQSQSLVADGIHSISDLLTDALVFVAAKHASQGPDSDHPYGHGRFETAGTLGLGIILFLVSVGIVWDAVARLFSPEELLIPEPLAIYAAIFSIVANEGLFHYTARAGRRVKSELLLANAWHHRSDAVSSIVVLVGVAGTMAGLPYLDAIAAVAVGVMIAKIAWDLGQPAFHELVDAGLEEERLDHIREIILSIGGVQAIHMLRTRRIGGEASVDVHVLVDPWLSVSEGHMISQMVTDRLRDEIDEVMDVTVHIDPEDDEVAVPCKGLPLRAEAEALLIGRWQEASIEVKPNRIVLHYLAGKINVDIYFPMNGYTTGEQAMELRKQLQEAVEVLPDFGVIRTFYG
jgi:cation diffusion facilitator family transporter